MKININFRRIAFFLSNFIFLLSGICLVLLGCVLINDTPRILLSQLFLEPGVIAQPLLYYVALAFICSGLIVCAVAMLGCWATWEPDSNCIMGFYMFLLILLLVCETSFGALAAFCPQIIGIASDRDRMVEGLMNNYGVVGRSQYTAAVDLAQTLLECCGMQSGSDYDGSKWWKREQENKHDLRVPRSCCFLSNTDDENSFLNPIPINASLCQAKTNSRYQYGRHVKGCIDKLNSWFKDHVVIFLTIGLALVIIQLAVLLCAFLVCLKRRKSVDGSMSSDNQTSLSSKKSEKNLTPMKPDRKNSGVQVETIEENVFATGKSYRFEGENNRRHVGNGVKKSNLIEESEEARSRRSDSSLPLVLRNEHFQRYEDGVRSWKQNRNDGRRGDARVMMYGVDEGPNVYFTPRTNERSDRSIFHGDLYDHKFNGELRSYLNKGMRNELDNNVFNDCEAT